MGVCKARESIIKANDGIQGKNEDPCDSALDRARLWVSPELRGKGTGNLAFDKETVFDGQGLGDWVTG